jgi:hypothetical protein
MSDKSPRRARRGLAVISSSALFAALAIAATMSWLPAPARADEASPDSTGAAIWWGVTEDLSWPLGNFDPPGDTPQLGLGGHLSFQPRYSPYGVRLEFGTASSEISIDNVPVEFLPGFTSNETVRAGNDLWWLLIGAQWDPRPRDTSVYAFASLGALHVSPQGVAGSDVHPVVPGLPPSSYVYAYDVGAGSRLVTGKRFGLNAEIEYLHGGAADYVGSAGVEGSNPTRYASRNSSIGLFIVRLGVVWRRH